MLRITGRTHEEQVYWKKLSHINRYRSAMEKERAMMKDPVTETYGVFNKDSILKLSEKSTDTEHSSVEMGNNQPAMVAVASAS